MQPTLKKLLIASVIAAAIAAYIILDLGRYLSLDYLQQQLGTIHAYYADNTLLSWAIFLVIYIGVVALSIPGAAIMTLAAGAIFGFTAGLVLVSFASAIGATLAFLVARLLFRDTVQRRFGAQLKTVNDGVEKDGAFYLFTLRLIPVFPFFLINVVMALTPLRTWTFYWVSQLGMLAGTAVYINAGTQVAQLESTSDILSVDLLIAFALLGLLPWIARAIVQPLQRARLYRGWKKPSHFDRNLIVIGAGSGGLVSAYIAATVKASVTLVEKDRMGGDCLNTGCVPSKALIRSAEVASLARHSPRYGLHQLQPEVDFAATMERIQAVIGKIEPHDSIERYTALGVDCRQGTARLLSPWEVEINGADGVQTLTSRNIVIASGAGPLVPTLPGLEQIDYLTTETLWTLRENPGRLLILGGGPIGCELAQAFSRLGAAVTQIEMLPRILPREDKDAADLVADALRRDGVNLMLGHKAVRFAVEDDSTVLYAEYNDSAVRIEFDRVLVAIGRRPHTEGMGLEALGIETEANGTLKLNEYLQTRLPNIYAVGDVAGPFQFTHTAAHQAWYAAVNALFGRLKKFKVDYSVIPWATFTSPEVARVGLNEQDANERGVAHEVTVYGIDDLDRAIADGNAEGFVKVLTAPGSDRILGVTIVGSHAGDLLAEYVLAMKHGLGLNKILGTIHIYPTMAEANKFAAGEWKKAHAPQGLLRLVERFHRWQR
ncbi:FAD-dependent oxidoreductase [Chromatocurvus halotolerans]|uniref:Pyruvate/2-oxoglutarate dehydrogenase complex dihydrolipoamide dehydrogenase (E3) component n=1 Tax=Chromatocurvus halotolerans TaxID=1132028 RepID=A0A4R2L3K2_9GAMM|nr:FAD-dependent oxidoreductase [Chromatocurvus halotolerans]TCO78386.1 pyruvate/2-oxoglutarate dehydrogenase complex dihydrolipoamide dehydrogenase (E3) component [Chromatocurvus halotolerans]